MDIVEKEIKIDNAIVELTDKIRYMNPKIETIEKLCELYDKFLYSVKQVHFEYYVFDDSIRNDICVVYMGRKMKMKTSTEFIDVIAEMLLDSVITWDNLDIAEKHLNLITEIFGNEFDELKGNKTSIVFFNKHNLEHCIVDGEVNIGMILNAIKDCIKNYDNISLGEMLHELDILPFSEIMPYVDLMSLDKYIIIDSNKFYENNCNDVGSGKADVFIEDPKYSDLMIFSNL